MPKLKKEYIDSGKVKYTYVNMAFLGEDSIKGSRAGHAVKDIAPNQFLEFQKMIFDNQPNHENTWLTESLIDKQIDKLDITDEKALKIKKEYRTKNSQSWKNAKEDQKESKKKRIQEAPTVYINDKKIKNPYDYQEYKEHLR